MSVAGKLSECAGSGQRTDTWKPVFSDVQGTFYKIEQLVATMKTSNVNT